MNTRRSDFNMAEASALMLLRRRKRSPKHPVTQSDPVRIVLPAAARDSLASLLPAGAGAGALGYAAVTVIRCCRIPVIPNLCAVDLCGAHRQFGLQCCDQLGRKYATLDSPRLQPNNEA